MIHTPVMSSCTIFSPMGLTLLSFLLREKTLLPKLIPLRPLLSLLSFLLVIGDGELLPVTAIRPELLLRTVRAVTWLTFDDMLRARVRFAFFVGATYRSSSRVGSKAMAYLLPLIKEKLALSILQSAKRRSVAIILVLTASFACSLLTGRHCRFRCHTLLRNCPPQILSSA